MATAARDLCEPRVGQRPHLRLIHAGEQPDDAPQRGRAAPRVYRRRRLFAALLAAAVVVGSGRLAALTAPVLAGVLGGAAAAAETAEAAGGEAAVGEAAVVVRAGDTLWSLAMPHRPSDTGPHQWAAQVAAYNGVDPGALVPGSVLRIPLLE